MLGRTRQVCVLLICYCPVQKGLQEAGWLRFSSLTYNLHVGRALSCSALYLAHNRYLVNVSYVGKRACPELMRYIKGILKDSSESVGL